MSSSRSSSPASRGGSPEPLTPRSKIKALLATVDSGDEATPRSGGSRKRRPQGISPPSTITSHKPRATAGDSSDDSDVEIRPRGRLAARMQATAGQSGSSDPKPAGTARERVKALLQREEDEANNNEKTAETEDAEAADAEDEDDELPKAPRRLKRREQRESTPQQNDESTRAPSPGLFVSSPAQPSPAKTAHDASESETELPTLKSDRFKALVERKRQERLAREAAEEAVREERRARQEKLSSELEQLDSNDDNASDITDDEGGRRLTQEARPTRKASKRAIEEMNRETQRMARSMQLAHEAKTRKKITTSSLFERFNYRPAGISEPKTESSSRPASPHSDVEMRDVETPPSSPPPAPNKQESDKISMEQQDASLTLDMAVPAVTQTTSKGKEKAVEPVAFPESEKRNRRVRVRLPVTANLATIPSDDELEITRTAKDKLDAVFNSVPSKNVPGSRSLQALRALAQVTSPRKDRTRKDEKGLTPAGLQISLQQKIRQQARLERERRLNMLKAQGIVVQTSEDREREMQEVEDIVARARDEAQKIMQEERAAAKKEKMESGEVDPLAWDDSDDEEYQDVGEEADAEASAVELSGSDEDEEEDDSETEGAGNHPLFEDEAEDAESEASEETMENHQANEVDEEDDDLLPAMNKRRPRKHNTTVLSDDEAEIEATPKPKTTVQMSPTGPSTISPVAPNSVLRSAKKTFIPGLPVEGPAGLSLTQIFAGTMDESQMTPGKAPTQTVMPSFEDFPDSNFSAAMSEPAEDLAMETLPGETQAETQGVELNMSQSQMRGLDSLLRDSYNTQASDMVELSQDGGFQEKTPLRQRFVEPPVSTVETVVLNQQTADAHDSPIVRRGRLRRKIDTEVGDGETVPEIVTTMQQSADNAFDAIRDGAKKEKKKRLIDEFNHKTSKAKEMVQEQADESEDEYAGLGGADGEDSDDESLASVEEMIDDNAADNVDEGKLAAFYADRERERDEKHVEKLFKDITTGLLRRKRGADYDLSDSDDDGEARRRMKRRQFAKMQKALFSDERVKKMAEDPGNQAFLRSIEDHGSDEEMDLLDTAEEPEPSGIDSQSQNDASQPVHQQQQTIPDSQPPRALGAAEGNKQLARTRRTKDGKKPSNIGEVRETLSSLLEEREASVIPATEAGSDSEGEQEQSSPPPSDKENQAPNPRRGRAAVVDRISLKRNSSSSLSTSSRLAFAATGAAAGASSFKVPALLRRATTNSLMSVSSTSSSGKGTASAGSGFGDDAKIKKSAGKRSGLNGFARENGRHAKMQESERRRQEKRVKGAERRMGVVGGLLGKGSFE